ncbi:MAG: hypothetical protein DRI69_04675 [Bacteroidetes bacterium]|nr:MAG: hypothetical protein DRI69_04675 [Bacteroidota bacterium]
MKTQTLSFWLKSFVILFALGLVACQGDTGPAGPEGPQGVAGEDGQNGAENCMQCHDNSQLIAAKVYQWENSVHYMGGHNERNDPACAVCHTSQGFVERIKTGEMETADVIQDPLPPNCYTCHQVHETYTDADWDFTSSDPVTLWVGGETKDIGLGNICLNCHQARLVTPAIPDLADTDSVTITSPFWGPHHGSQGALFTGSSSYEVGEGYTNSNHSTLLVGTGCIECHMAEATKGRDAGGHTFRVESEDGVLNFNACVTCHSDQAALLVLKEETQAELEAALGGLKIALTDIGILSFQFGSDRATPGSWKPVEVGALWNYLYLEEDKSYGIHNFTYAMTLVENSIAALN